MWQRKSKPATNGTKRSRKSRSIGFAGFLFLTACSQAPSSSEPISSELRIAHLTDLAWQDRNRSGQPTEFMPEDRYQAVLTDLRSSSSDLFLLRGIGSANALTKLREDMQSTEGPGWVDTYIPGPTPYAGIGFLTSEPPREVVHLANQTYEIEGRTYQPLAGGIRIASTAGQDLWLWNATLPDPATPYERRRNEARLLAQALRPYVESKDLILLSVHCREEPDSPMVRMWTDLGLVPLFAEDSKGDRWTHRDPEGRVYVQDQLLFASPSLAALLPAPPRIYEKADLRHAGEFRHQQVWLP